MTPSGRFSRLAALRGRILIGALVVAAPAADAQTTVDLVVAKDSTIRGGSYASTRHGTEALLATRSSDDQTYERRAVLTFDTHTTMPARSAIQSATLVLTVRGGNSEVRTLSAYCVPVSFEQEDVTWKKRKASIYWSHSGGDTSGSPVQATASAVAGSQVTFDVTSLVQKVVNGDYGSRYARFLVADAGSSSRGSYREYHSSESSSAALRPRLIVVHGGSGGEPTPPGGSVSPDSSGNVTLTADGVSARAGKWAIETSSGALSGKVVRHPNANMGKIATALASPAHYFEMSFEAQAGKPYRLWIRGKADGDDWANDSVHVQFSGTVNSSGSASYRIGTTSSAVVNLEECNGCGVAGWTWEDNGWGGRGVLGPEIYFASSGTQTIRVQTREDGLAIDRILLSPSTNLTESPGGVSTSDAAPPSEPPPSGSTGATLTVLQWNIHHGVGTDGRYDLQRFVTWMAKWRPDVISINEAEKYTSWGTEDQPARFRDLLQAATGQTWYSHFAQEYGDWSANGKGNLILSRFPFVSTGREVLSWDRTVAIATIVVNGRNVSIMSTHLDPESQSRRESQAQQVISLAASWGEPRIVAGDLNAWPDQSSIAVMAGQYYDSWAEAERAGTATSFSGNSPFGATKKGRIDYIFHSHGASVLTLKSVQVPDTRSSSGVKPSDHRPVLTTYEVR